MTKIVHTIWALPLHCTGKSLFKMCFDVALEDRHGNVFPIGPPMISFIFVLGVYAIVSSLNVYPDNFRKPSPALMGLYEFMVTLFILDFSLAYVWAPIDALVYVSLKELVHKIFMYLHYEKAAEWTLDNTYPMTILCYAIAISFLLIALHVTRWSDIIADREFGLLTFFGCKTTTMTTSSLSNVKSTSSIDEYDDVASRVRKNRRRKNQKDE